MWVIPRVIVNKIMGHAQRSLPRECVGILAGRQGQIDSWHPLPNVRSEQDRFLADPQSQIDLFKRLREEKRELLAIYHSHPQGQVTPSARDLEESHYPQALHLIVSLATNGRLEMQGFLLADGEARPQEVTIQG